MGRALGLVALLSAALPAAGEEDRFAWADGVGMRPCTELETIADSDLIPWVRGYWTGANLYLGSSHLCVERARIAGIAAADIRVLLRVHCTGIENGTIMTSAFNVLRGLPTLKGSRAAVCPEQ
jgi:hypothetical protein